MPDPHGSPIYTRHHAPDYASTIVHLALEEMGVPYQLALKDFAGGELSAPAYRKVNPAGLIPALETPDGPIFETGAILLWLTDRHGILSPQPQDPDRGAFLSWLFFTSNSLHAAALGMFYPHRPAGEAATDAARAASRGQVLSRLALIETMILEKHPRFLSAQEPGVLGYYIGMLMRWLSLQPAPHAIDPKAFPALHGVLAAHETRAAALRVATSDGLGPTPFTNPGP